MGRNVSEKKRGRLIVVISLFLMVLSFFENSGRVEAVVQLVPRVNGSGEILAGIANEDYVVFGKYKHRLISNTGSNESIATPVLWRVMSADATPGAGQKKAILLTHYLVDKMPYDSGDDNTWSGSDVQVWLNNTTSGFLQYFSTPEQSAMHLYPDGTDGGSGSKVTLPSFWTDDSGVWYDWEYRGELNDWFGPNDVTNNGSTFGPNSLARRAHFKGASFTYDTTDLGWYYWTRSPEAGVTDYAWGVLFDGYLLGLLVDRSAVAARPACFLNLESLIFKSVSNDFDLGSSSAGVAGSPENPYVLVLPNEVPTSAPTGWATKFVSADNAPLRATRNGATITLEWGHNLTPAVKQWPTPADFVLSTGERPIRVTSDAGDKKRLTLTFANTITGSNLTLSYNLNTDAIVFSKSGNVASVVNSFSNIAVTSSVAPLPNISPTQAYFDGEAPKDLTFTLRGAALTAVERETLTLTLMTDDLTNIALTATDYSVASGNLTLSQTFLSQLQDGRHTLTLHNGSAQVGKVTLIVLNNTVGKNNPSQPTSSSGCNNGLGLEALGLLFAGAALLRKKR